MGLEREKENVCWVRCCFSGSNIILAIMEGGERWCACMCPKQPWLDSISVLY